MCLSFQQPAAVGLRLRAAAAPHHVVRGEEMTKPHCTLQPKTNIVLILVWAGLAIFSSTRLNPFPIGLITVCAIFGVLGGIMQVLSLNQGRENFLNAQTMLGVRAQLKKTKWGKRYIYFLWSTGVVIFIFAIFAGNPLWAWLSGYFTMMFVRDVVTLKSTFELAKLHTPAA